MKNVLILVITSIIVLAFTSMATAQKIELTPQMKAWEPVLGKWSGNEESRNSPTGTWRKNSVEWEHRSEGFCLINRFNIGVEENVHIEIIGYDPVKKCYVGTSFGGDGTWHSINSTGWNGTVHILNWTDTTVDRKVEIGRTTMEYSPDFKSVQGTVEVFTAGKWWSKLRIQGTKIE